MTVRAIPAAIVAVVGLWLAGCKPPEGADILLLAGSEKQRRACQSAFGDTEAAPMEDASGAKWVWHLSPDGVSEQWCRKDRSGELSAWAETDSGTLATHKLRLEIDGRPALLQPLGELETAGEVTGE